MSQPEPLAPKDGRISRFSFWKPEPVPTREAGISAVELQPLGVLRQVAARLMDVPNMAELISPPWKQQGDGLQLMWGVEEGVILNVRVEQGPPAPGEVLTINAASAAPNKTFYRLYVQIYEQFGVTVLDEKAHEFLPPREFRARLAG